MFWQFLDNHNRLGRSISNTKLFLYELYFLDQTLVMYKILDILVISYDDVVCMIIENKNIFPCKIFLFCFKNKTPLDYVLISLLFIRTDVKILQTTSLFFRGSMTIFFINNQNNKFCLKRIDVKI
jgi:hypothetical protein